MHHTEYIMHFLSVRDWMSSQSWYDMVQTGVVAKGGLLHWSLLVDVGIAAIIWPLSLALLMRQAQTAGIVLWPIRLLGMFLYISAVEAYRHFGTMARWTDPLVTFPWRPGFAPLGVVTDRISRHT